MTNKYAVTVCAAALMIFAAPSLVNAQDSQTMEQSLKAASTQPQPAAQATPVQTTQVQTQRVSPAAPQTITATPPATIDTAPAPASTDLPVPTGAQTDANTVDLSAMSGSTTTSNAAPAVATPAAPPPPPTPVLVTSNPQTEAAATRRQVDPSTTDRITNLRDAVAVGVLVSPQTEAVENNRRATDEELNQARALWLPSVDARADAGYQYTNRKFDGTPGRQSDSGTTAQGSLTLTQLLFDGFNTQYENTRQKWRVRSAAHRVRETAEFVGLDIIESYIDVLRQRELLAEFERESHKETSPESAGFFARVKDFFEGRGG